MWKQQFQCQIHVFMLFLFPYFSELSPLHNCLHFLWEEASFPKREKKILITVVALEHWGDFQSPEPLETFGSLKSKAGAPGWIPQSVERLVGSRKKLFQPEEFWDSTNPCGTQLPQANNSSLKLSSRGEKLLQNLVAKWTPGFVGSLEMDRHPLTGRGLFNPKAFYTEHLWICDSYRGNLYYIIVM